MPAPYIPARDADFQSWAVNFSTLITATPAAFGLLSTDATAIATNYATWNAAYLLATSPTTKTASTVADKDTARTTSTAIFRGYAQRIASNPGVTTENKIAVGVNPRTNSPTKIPAPATNPVLTLDTALNQQHIIRFRDSSASPSVKAKPFGATGIQVFGALVANGGGTPGISASNTLMGTFTKSPFVMQFTGPDVGKQAYYAARWITRKGLTGPLSPQVNFTVAGN